MPFNIDLHTHSFFSGDGISSPEDLIAAARAKGLNGIAITDHNTCDAVNYLLEKGLMRLDGLPVNDFLVLPGVEVTTADGHLLCIDAAVSPFLRIRMICSAPVSVFPLWKHCQWTRSRFSTRRLPCAATTVTLSSMRRFAVCP